MGKASIDDARRVKAKAGDLARRENCSVAGVGLTKIDEGYAVKVNLQTDPAPTAHLPTRIDGVPVLYHVIGRITVRRAS